MAAGGKSMERLKDDEELVAALRDAVELRCQLLLPLSGHALLRLLRG